MRLWHYKIIKYLPNVNQRAFARSTTEPKTYTQPVIEELKNKRRVIMKIENKNVSEAELRTSGVI